MLIHGFPGNGSIQVRIHLLNSYEECEKTIKAPEGEYFEKFVKSDNPEWTICRKPIKNAEPFLNSVYGKKFEFGQRLVKAIPA